MITILLRHQFVDATDHLQIRIYAKQAHPNDLQEALVRDLYLESFLRSTRERPSKNYVDSHKVKTRKECVETPPSSSLPSPGGFRENCYSCRHPGQSRKYCSQDKSNSKPESADAEQYQYKPCCWNCSKGHRTRECTRVPANDRKQAEGNQQRLAERVGRQPESPRPHSA